MDLEITIQISGVKYETKIEKIDIQDKKVTQEGIIENDVCELHSLDSQRFDPLTLKSEVKLLRARLKYFLYLW